MVAPEVKFVSQNTLYGTNERLFQLVLPLIFILLPCKKSLLYSLVCKAQVLFTGFFDKDDQV